MQQDAKPEMQLAALLTDAACRIAALPTFCRSGELWCSMCGKAPHSHMRLAAVEHREGRPEC